MWHIIMLHILMCAGEISIEELEESLAWLRVNVTAPQLRAAFQDADWDGSGTIEYDEFERILLDLRRMPGPPSTLFPLPSVLFPPTPPRAPLLPILLHMCFLWCIY
jgi:hypothetical protein